MNDLVQEYFLKFEKKPILKNYLDFFSVSTWDRIKFTRNHKGLKVFETTFTQNLIYSIKKSITTKESNFYLYESLDETTNGNDLEIFIETARGYLFFPTQAKIIYKNEKYGSLKYKKNGEYQIKSLIDYSLREKGTPLYLFYNYCKDSKELEFLKSKITDNIETYGCSISLAKNILKKFFNKSTIKSIGFYDLFLDNSYPLNILCSDLIKSLNLTDNKLTFFTKTELEKNKNWKNLFEVIGLGYIHNPFVFSKDKTNTNKPLVEDKFNPKFRILISMEKNELSHEIIGLA